MFLLVKMMHDLKEKKDSIYLNEHDISDGDNCF